jgi:hypothetical protein
MLLLSPKKSIILESLEKIHKSQQKKQKSPHDFTPFKELENHL